MAGRARSRAPRRRAPARWRWLLAAAALLAGLWVTSRVIAPASADIYTWTDDEGVVHFTNLRPPRGKGAKKLISETPRKGTKASAERGACAGCDRVPARDTSPERYHRYDGEIAEASALYRIPEALIRAVIRTESDYDPHVVSAVGAKGLMQLMPAAQADMGVSDVFDPRLNILGGTRYLRILANRFDGDVVLTIAAYHAGAGAVAMYGNQVPPYERTRQYLR
ncbi:MAG TPA: lytic transglycosylase domain-containing protein, partial [Kofleriaceae bacterium]|nr:lytic transglycosylase domain-containing protein [Kofleriaceae bacterium]